MNALFCSMDDKTVVAYLLAECDANPNSIANNGSTPTSLAESSEVVKLLLKYGGVTNNPTKWFLAAQYTTSLATKPDVPPVPVKVQDEKTDKSELIRALTAEELASWTPKKYRETSV